MGFFKVIPSTYDFLKSQNQSFNNSNHLYLSDDLV